MSFWFGRWSGYNRYRNSEGGAAAKKAPTPKEVEATTVQSNVYKMQTKRYELFKAQNTSTGHFDVTFDIDRKKVHANRYVLATTSDALDEFLSEHDDDDGTAIKITKYSHKSFYEFLCFIYSGGCKLSQANIFQLADMAVVYDVPLLKDYCDGFLSKMKYKVDNENVYDTMELAAKYSLESFTDSLNTFVKQNFGSLINADKFLTLKKDVIKLLCSYTKTSDQEEAFFDAVYKWAQRQASSGDGDLTQQKSIKGELAGILSEIKFRQMKYEFVMRSVVPKGFLFPSSELYKIILDSQRPGEQDGEAFKAIYDLAEKTVNKKQNAVPDPNFDVHTAISKELTAILSSVNFSNMTLDFVKDFILEKESLFAPAQLYKILLKCKKRPDQEEEYFKIVYKLAETEAAKKVAGSSTDEVTVLDDAIKAEMAEILPSIQYNRMSKTFLAEFIVPKGFLSDDQASRSYNITVRVQNADKSITGTFEDHLGIHDEIQKFYRKNLSPRTTTKQRFPFLKFPVPKVPSTLKKMKGVDWYLVLEKDGVLTFKHQTMIERNDYLLAEMKASFNFQLTMKRHTFIFATR